MKYADHLIAIACEQEVPGTRTRTQTQTKTQSIEDPANFFQALYLYIARSQKPITREGTDRFMDTLFSHEDMQPLLDPTTATQFQNEFATLYLPTLTPAYQSFWTHIIVPAWRQHQELHQTLKNTAVPSSPESYCTGPDF
jgi:hypothetical protein